MIECVFHVRVGPTGCSVLLPEGSVIQRKAFLVGFNPLQMEVFVLCPPPEPFEVAGMKIG